jgi:hypothetical protein
MVLKKLLVVHEHMSDVIHLARTAGAEKRIILNLKSLDTKACQGKLPNTGWFRPILGKKGECLGYLCGKGIKVVTNLAPGMIPKGRRV